jgi:hypothetical protein
LKSICKVSLTIVGQIVGCAVLLLLATGVLYSIKNSIDSQTSWYQSIPVYSLIWLGIALFLHRWSGTAVPLFSVFKTKALGHFIVLGSVTYLWIEVVFR